MDEVMPKDGVKQTRNYTERYTPENFLSILESVEGSDSTQKLADVVGYTYRTAQTKLSEIEEERGLTARKVGNAKLWELNSSEDG